MGGGTYIRAGSSKNTSIIFSLTEGVGALAEALKVFKVSYIHLLLPILTKFLTKTIFTKGKISFKQN